MCEYSNCFKIKIHGRNHKKELEALMKIYGGMVKTDAKLWPDEYWYYTDTDRKILEHSGLILSVHGNKLDKTNRERV